VLCLSIASIGDTLNIFYFHGPSFVLSGKQRGRAGGCHKKKKKNFWNYLSNNANNQRGSSEAYKVHIVFCGSCLQYNKSPEAVLAFQVVHLCTKYTSLPVLLGIVQPQKLLSIKCPRRVLGDRHTFFMNRCRFFFCFRTKCFLVFCWDIWVLVLVGDRKFPAKTKIKNQQLGRD